MTLLSRRPALVFLCVLATAALFAQGPGSATTAPGFIIAGRIVDPEHLRPKDAALLLGRQDGDTYRRTPLDVAADDSFLSARLTPGTYVLELVRDAYAPGAIGGVIGFAVVTVTTSDVSGIRVDVRRDSKITGRLRLDGDNPRAKAPLQIIVLPMLALDGAQVPIGNPGEPGPDDTFVLRNAFGPRVLRVGYRLAPGSPWWPSRVLLDGKDVTNVPTDFSERPGAQLEVVFTQHPARLAGIVTDAQGQPVSEPWVLVTGSDAASSQPWSTTAQIVRGNATGRYATTVPPGEYRLNAVAGSTFPSARVARDGMSRIAFGGVTVVVNDRETKRVDVTLQVR